MIAAGVESFVNEPLFIGGDCIACVYAGGELVYQGGPTPKELLAAALAEAAGVNRYWYTAVTVGTFDTAYTTAQTVYDDSGSADTDYTSAEAALRSAIAGLKQAIIAGPMSVQGPGNTAPPTKTAPLPSGFTYDGIGTLETVSNLPTRFAITNLAVNSGVVSGTMEKYLSGAGMATVYFYVREIPGVTQKALTVTLS